MGEITALKGGADNGKVRNLRQESGLRDPGVSLSQALEQDLEAEHQARKSGGERNS